MMLRFCLTDFIQLVSYVSYHIINESTRRKTALQPQQTEARSRAPRHKVPEIFFFFFFFFSFSPLANIFSKMSSDFLITFCFHRFHTFVPSHDLSPRHWRFLFGLRRWSPFWPEQIFVCSFSTCYHKLTMTSKQKGKEV